MVLCAKILGLNSLENISSDDNSNEDIILEIVLEVTLIKIETFLNQLKFYVD